MTKKVLLLAAAFVCFAGLAQAATAEKTATPAQKTQQNRMRACAEQYHQKNIAKSEYRKFMSGCLKKKPDAKASAAKPAIAQ